MELIFLQLVENKKRKKNKKKRYEFEAHCFYISRVVIEEKLKTL
jgi:hypothetical protein